MADPQPANENSLIESLSKLFAVALGLQYLLGFLVVATYLTGYGVTSVATLHPQYLIAGIWALGPLVLLGSLVFALRLDEQAAPEVKGEFNWHRFAVSSRGQLLAPPTLHTKRKSTTARAALYCFNGRFPRRITPSLPHGRSMTRTFPHFLAMCLATISRFVRVRIRV
jgi:hypothetical protein